MSDQKSAATTAANESGLSRCAFDPDVMQDLACKLASKSFAEGGCPIGAVIVDDASGKILGQGHNNLVQEENPILHGEMSALRDAGRISKHASSYRNATMFTSLSPCLMCTGAILVFKFGRVVISDDQNCGDNTQNLELLRKNGCEVIVRNHPATVKLCKQFRESKPELWLEDWGGK